MFAGDNKLTLTSAYEGDENNKINKINSPVTFDLISDLPLTFPQCLSSTIHHIFFDEISLSSHILLTFLSQLKSICNEILQIAKDDFLAPKIDDTFNVNFNKLRGIVDFECLISHQPYYFKLLINSYLKIPNFSESIKPTSVLKPTDNAISFPNESNSEIISTQTLEGVGTAYIYPTSILTQLVTGESMSFNSKSVFFMHGNNILEFKKGDIIPEDIQKCLTVAKSIFNNKT